MHIVRATNPPSMTVVVDSVILGDLIFSVQSHPDFKRIDLVVVDSKNGRAFDPRSRVRYIDGTKQLGETLYPVIPSGVRILAKVHVHKASTMIFQRNIEEVEING